MTVGMPRTSYVVDGTILRRYEHTLRSAPDGETSADRDHDRGCGARRRPVVHSLDVVPVRVEREGRVVARVVVPLAGRTVVAAARGEHRRVKTVDRLAVGRLEREVQVARGRTVRRDVELVGPEGALALTAQPAAERLERGRVEALRGVEVAHAQVHVVEQTAGVVLGHGARGTVTSGTVRRMCAAKSETFKRRSEDEVEHLAD